MVGKKYYKILIIFFLAFAYTGCGKKISRLEIGGIADGEKNRRRIVSDSFNRTNNLTTLGNAETGHLWNYTGGAVYGVQNNRAVLISAGGGALVQINETDLIAIQIEISVSGTDFSLIFRYISGATHWVLQFDTSLGGLRLEKDINGISTVRGITSISIANGDTMRIELRGCNIQAYISGAKIFDIIDCDAGGETGYGFEDTAGGTVFDNFFIEALE